jgi:uncharacterized protein YjiS (DUF1127 family)
MRNLAFALFPSLGSDPGAVPSSQLGRLARWGRARLRYRHALKELKQLDDRDLDGLGIGRVDFPMLAERHVAGLQPLTPAQLVSLRRL